MKRRLIALIATVAAGGVVFIAPAAASASYETWGACEIWAEANHDGQESEGWVYLSGGATIRCTSSETGAEMTQEYLNAASGWEWEELSSSGWDFGELEAWAGFPSRVAGPAYYRVRGNYYSEESPGVPELYSEVGYL